MNNFTYMKDKNFDQGRYYIGASDIPTLAMLNVKYNSTPLTLWEEKIGNRSSFKGNERTKAGSELEPLILKWGLEKIGDHGPEFLNRFMLSRYNNTPDFISHFSFTEAKHPEYSFLVAHADLINNEKPFIMEAKSTGFFGGTRKDDINLGYDKDDLSANGIPSSVYLQIQTQMLCYDIPEAYVSVIIDTGIHRLYGPIMSHKRTQENILALAEKFWWHVENKKPPQPKTWKDVTSLFPNLDTESKTIVAGTEEIKVLEIKERARRLREKQKKIKEELDDLKNAIGLILGENAYLENAEGAGLAKAYNVTREYSKLSEIKKECTKEYEKLLSKNLIYEKTHRDLKF